MNDLETPYKKLKAVEDQIENNFLLQVYSDAFRKKMYGPPIFTANNSHLTTIKDIKRACGDRAMEIIQHYFEMPDSDGWFEKQGYTLYELHRSLNRVNASFSKKHSHKHTGTNIEEIFHCDSCWKPFTLIHGLAFNYDKLIRCQECEKEGKPMKHVSMTERRAAIFGLTKSFPSMPEFIVVEE